MGGGADRTLADAEQVGDLGVGQRLVVAQREHRPLLARQGGEQAPYGVVLGEIRLRRSDRIHAVEAGRARARGGVLAGAQVLVDDDPAQVCRRRRHLDQPPPLAVGAQQGALQHVLGVGEVAGQHIGQAQQGRRARGNQRVEVAGRHTL